MKNHWIVVVFAIACFGSKANATLLLCDSFSDYTTGSLIYQIGGLGGKGHWDSFDLPEGFIQPDKGQYRFVVSNVVLSSYITTHPKSIGLPSTSTNCEIKRKLGISLGQNGTTRYLRFLLRANYPQGSLWPTGSYLGLELRSGTEPRVYVGKGTSGTFAIGTAAGSGYVNAPGTFVASTTYVMVLKMQFQSGNDILTLYVDPSSSQEPASGTTRTDLDLGQPDIMAVRGNLSMSVDDIVVADTYADAMNVTSLPTIPTITLDSGGVVEGNTGTNFLTFTARLSPAVSHQVSVDFKTINGNATAGQDFISTSGTLLFSPGALSATNTVAIVGDVTVETNETFYVSLSFPVSAKFNSGSSATTSPFVITNDDASLPSPLSYTRTQTNFVISWTADSSAYRLEVSTNLFGAPWFWVSPVQQIQLSPTNYLFQATEFFVGKGRFYRLRKSP